MFRLAVVRGDDVVFSCEVRSPCLLGRAADNVVSVVDELVSWRHAVVWPDGVRLFVRDLGSSNGTFVNGVRIMSAAALEDGDVLRLGSEVEIRVERQTVDLAPRVHVVEDVAMGVRMRFVADRFRIGPEPGANLVVACEPVSLRLGAACGVEIVGADGTRVVPFDEPFVVGGRTLVVREMLDNRSRTDVRVPYPYLVIATKDASGGYEARVTDPTTGLEHRFKGGNRALLLYLLACRRHDDDVRGLRSDVIGWCEDVEVKRALWGRMADDNKLNVLVHKVRRSLEQAGFDPWFLARTARALRLLVPVVVEDIAK